jgi:hypothetical protein
MLTANVTRALTFVCGGFLLLESLVRAYGSTPFPFDFLHGLAIWGLLGFGLAWLILRERERVGGNLGAGERARLWAVGAVVCFAGIGWSWTGGAPRFVSPTLCFAGALVCAVGALVSAHDARDATPRERASARAAAGVAVGLAIIPILLFGALILLLLTSDSSFFE